MADQKKSDISKVVGHSLWPKFQNILHITDDIIEQLKAKSCDKKESEAEQRQPHIHHNDTPADLLSLEEMETSSKSNDRRLDFLFESLDTVLQQHSEFLTLLQEESGTTDRKKGGDCSGPSKAEHEQARRGEISSPDSNANSNVRKSGDEGTLVDNEESASETVDESDEEGESTGDGQPKYARDNYWGKLADKEHEKAKAITDAEEPGGIVYTVFCIDTSASMAGEPWRKMTEFVYEFLNHSTVVVGNGEYEERIGVVVFGRKTRVLQHYTSDYNKIRQHIGDLHPGGPSPLYGGLLISFRVAEAAPNFTLKEHNGEVRLHHKPRILLITDGLASGSDVIGGPEVSDNASIMDGQCATTHIGHRITEFGYNLWVLPVGDYHETFMQTFSKESNARIISTHTDRERTLKRMEHCKPAGEFIYRLSSANPVFMERLKSTEEIAEEYPQLSMEDQDAILYIVNKTLDEFEHDRDRDNKNNDTLDLGTRVRRGPDWDLSHTEDKNLPGTVIGFREDNYVRVWWDNENTGIYLFDTQTGKFEVREVNERRTMTTDGDIQVGYFMKRGMDWNYKGEENHDSKDSVGIVLRVQPQRMLRIVWPNGNTYRYRYGYMGVFDLTMCEPNEVPQKKKNKNKTTHTKSRSKVEVIPKVKSGSNFCESSAGKGSLETVEGNEDVKPSTDTAMHNNVDNDEYQTEDSHLSNEEQDHVGCSKVARHAPSEDNTNTEVHEGKLSNSDHLPDPSRIGDKMASNRRGCGRAENSSLEPQNLNNLRNQEDKRELSEEGVEIEREDEIESNNEGEGQRERSVKLDIRSKDGKAGQSVVKTREKRFLCVTNKRESAEKPSQQSTVKDEEDGSLKCVASQDEVDENSTTEQCLRPFPETGSSWQYQNEDGTWMTYSSHICEVVECAFTKKPKSTLLIMIDNKRYRINLARMESLHIQSSTTCNIRRCGTP